MIGILNITHCEIRGVCRTKCLLPCHRDTISCIQIFLLKAGITRAWFLKFGIQSRLTSSFIHMNNWYKSTNLNESSVISFAPPFPKQGLTYLVTCYISVLPPDTSHFFIRYRDHGVDVKELSDIRRRLRKLKRAGFWCHWLSVAISLAEDYPMVAVSSLD